MNRLTLDKSIAIVTEFALGVKVNSGKLGKYYQNVTVS